MRKKNKLFPADLGMVVTDFLSEHFARIMDYSFTAKIEEEFDDVASGKVVWNKMIGNFYKPFHDQVVHTMEHAGRIKGERVLGTDPESGKPVVARLGRFGPMIQIGSTEDEEKPKFATLKKDQSIETISFEEAMDLFRLPLSLGLYQDKEVVIGAGRFGPYVKWDEQFISIPRGEDPLSLDMDRAIELIEEKRQADAPIATYQGQPVTKGKGRFGPFIKWGELFINVPKAYNFDHLSQQDINELVSKKIEKEANRFIQQWPEEKIAVENGRWGPFIRFGKLMLKLTRNAEGEKYTAEELAAISLDEVKAMIVQQIPDAFEKKTKKTAAKKAPAKKAALKKTVTKKVPVKQAASAAPKKAGRQKEIINTLLPPNEIKALFSLIDDPDPEVYDTVAGQILHYGKEIIPSLEHFWETTADETLQERIAQLIHRVHFQDLQRDFKTWAQAKNPELLRGAILIARYQYPDLNLPFLLTQFDQIRRNLWLELNNYLTPIEKINIFNSILYNYYKLQGHELTERKPEHFFINKVLESKQGNTFSLGILQLALAELLDIPVFAVAVPRQFLLAYFDSLKHFYTTDESFIRQISFFIDPMNGMVYTQTDVDNYLQKIKAGMKRSAFFEPQPAIKVIYNMLQELALCYSYNKDEDREAEIRQLMAILNGEEEEG